MSAPEAAFLSAPFPVHHALVARPVPRRWPCTFSSSVRSAVRRRSRSSPTWPCRASDDASNFTELEQQIRAYLSSCDDPGPNPLAYTALGAAGRTDLVSQIMEHGGYLEVSRRLGIPVDESYFVPPPTVPNSEKWAFNTVEDKASVVVGRDLEARLSTAGKVAEELKASRGSRAVGQERRALRTGVPTAKDLRAASEQFVPPVKDEVVPEGEGFVLTARMRCGMLALAAVTAAGFGRASSDVIDVQVIESLRLVAESLALAHLVVALYGGAVLAAQYKRSRVLWSAKLLLSGPLGLSYLRSLGSL